MFWKGDQIISDEKTIYCSQLLCGHGFKIRQHCQCKRTGLRRISIYLDYHAVIIVSLFMLKTNIVLFGITEEDIEYQLGIMKDLSPHAVIKI